MNKEKEDLDYQFEDSEAYRSWSDKLTIKQIVMKQLQKCMDEGSKEMDKGGKRITIIDGVPYEIMIPNQREIVINSIEMLRILVAPIIKKNKEVIDEQLKKFEDDLIILINTVKEEEEKLKGELDKKDNKEAYIKNYNRRLSDIENSFLMEKVILYKEKLLTAISFLLNYINYFEEEGFTGGVKDAGLRKKSSTRMD